MPKPHPKACLGKVVGMIAVVFPGQGSQKPGMGHDLYNRFDVAREVFARVGQATGTDVAKLCFETDEDTLRQTQNAQMALYTCGVAAFLCLKALRPGLKVKYFAGHSVGEYAALACAGIVGTEDGARAVQKRGQVMAESGRLRPGGMAAILGMERSALEEVCREASTYGEVVVVANDNCPGQLVISGDNAAVERACPMATAKGAKRAIPLNVSGAFHSPLMEEPAKQMTEVLATIAFKDAKDGCAVVSNVAAEPISNAEGWAERLVAQLRNPVRWTESVQRMAADGISTYIECGGDVLAGLIKKTHREAVCLKVADAETLKATAESLTLDA